jgi:hypothetical protein
MSGPWMCLDVEHGHALCRACSSVDCHSSIVTRNGKLFPYCERVASNGLPIETPYVATGIAG